MSGAMFEGQVHHPQVFIAALREYHASEVERRGELANALADAIITKRVDLAEVRQALFETSEHALMSTLDQLLDLIAPYIEEGGVDE